MMRTVLIVLVGCASSATAIAKPSCKPVTRELELKSADGLVVHGTYHAPCKVEHPPIVVLAHQMCQTRAEWSDKAHDWVGALDARGIATLAIDLRGHGASTAWPDGSTHDLCKERGDDDAAARFPAMVDDVAAALAWVEAQGRAKVVVVGASIGANSALVAGGRDSHVVLAIALSPGVDYMGIHPGAAIGTLGARAVLYAADDDKRSAAAVRTFAGETKAASTKVFADGGHANAIVAAHPELLGELADRIAKSLR